MKNFLKELLFDILKNHKLFNKIPFCERSFINDDDPNSLYIFIEGGYLIYIYQFMEECNGGVAVWFPNEWDVIDKDNGKQELVVEELQKPLIENKSVQGPNFAFNGNYNTWNSPNELGELIVEFFQNQGNIN